MTTGGVKLKALGQHLLIELYGCDARILNAAEAIRETMIATARLVNATILEVFQRKFEPQGVTVVVVIAESHLSIHTWPEFGYAAVDVFTCSEEPIGDEVVSLLRESLQATNVATVEVKRGLMAVPNQSKMIAAAR